MKKKEHLSKRFYSTVFCHQINKNDYRNLKRFNGFNVGNISYTKFQFIQKFITGNEYKHWSR